MKKKGIVLSILGIVLVSSLLIVLVTKNTKKTFMQDGVLFALTLNGNSITSFPDGYETGKYTVNVECENAKGIWLYDEDDGKWKLVLEDVTDKVSCYLDFKDANLVTTANANSDYLNQTIIDMAVEGTSDGTDQAEGDVVHETFTDADSNVVDTGYRYEGKSPNNYIWFNNELWRIIGVFDTCTALDDSGNCTTTETLTKIMRNESVGGLVWNKSSNNNWPDSSLYNLLNTNYLNSTNGTDSGYCYGYSTTVKANCDYSEIGLKGTSSYYGSMIKNVVWNLGGMSPTSGAENYSSSPASTWYTYERGTIVYSGRDTKTTGYIGLMYGSDYGYSVKASSNCNRSKTLSSYNTAYCVSESWMYGQGYEWMITPRSDISYNACYVHYSGRVSFDTVDSYAVAVRPVLYLDSSVYVVNGEEDNVGSISNPYQIAK